MKTKFSGTVLKLSRSMFVCWTLLAFTGLCALALEPADLRCEYGHNPTAVDAEHPRLSWAYEADPAVRGQLQTAYEIIVSSSPELLEKNKGDLWDTGKSPRGTHCILRTPENRLRPRRLAFGKCARGMAKERFPDGASPPNSPWVC